MGSTKLIWIITGTCFLPNVGRKTPNFSEWFLFQLPYPHREKFASQKQSCFVNPLLLRRINHSSFFCRVNEKWLKVLTPQRWNSTSRWLTLLLARLSLFWFDCRAKVLQYTSSFMLWAPTTNNLDMTEMIMWSSTRRTSSLAERVTLLKPIQDWWTSLVLNTATTVSCITDQQ